LKERRKEGKRRRKNKLIENQIREEEEVEGSIEIFDLFDFNEMDKMDPDSIFFSER
jgi:hypothetical protein